MDILIIAFMFFCVGFLIGHNSNRDKGGYEDL